MMLNSTFFKLNKISILLVLISVLFYLSFAYDLIRTDYTKLVVLYAGLFLLFYKLVQINSTNTKFLIYSAFLFRAVFIFAVPNLSQDFYRFIWDGRMILEGFNPYLYTPESFISQNLYPVEQAKELYSGMGNLNGSHFTNYPPLNQLCFLISNLFGSKSILSSIVVLRIIIIAADFGTLYFGQKLLRLFNLPSQRIFWYILNPFIIIELTGNLHFEGVMIFFLIWSLYLIHKGHWKIAALIFTLSISVKLIPLMLLPLLIQKLGWKKSLGFYSIIGVSTLILFAPFYSVEFVNNYVSTVGLWFQNFEFNASLYYIARAIGFAVSGYNEIAIIGKIIPALVFIFIIILAFKRNNKTTQKLISGMLIALSFYFFTTTTVHPWYIATLLVLSVFTDYKFPLVWSAVIILSYLAYASFNNSENMLVITLEYVIVYGVLCYEIFFKKKVNLVSNV